MDRRSCPICGDSVVGGARKIYDSPRCRKQAELDSRATRRIAEFAEAEVDDQVATREQLLKLATIAARRGSMAAVRLLLEEFRRDGGSPGKTDFMDELAKRRLETS